MENSEITERNSTGLSICCGGPARGAARDAVEGAVKDAAEGAEAGAGGLRISADAKADADVLEFSERAGGENFRNFNAAACAARSFFPSSIHLIFGDVKCSSQSHFRISFLDHTVHFPSFSMSANALAIDILPS